MSEDKNFSKTELEELNGPDNLHLVIHGKVYKVAKFLAEHPGGDEVLLGEAGKDATESFEDVGHSDEARDLMDTFKVGTCTEKLSADGGQKKASGGAVKPTAKADAGSVNYILPLAALIAWLAYRYYQQNYA